jgi:hypothetical protein
MDKLKVISQAGKSTLKSPSTGWTSGAEIETIEHFPFC